MIKNMGPNNAEFNVLEVGVGLCSRTYTCIQLFREKLSEKCARDNPESNMGYHQYTVSDDCTCRTYFCCFPLALANTFPRPFVPILSNFFKEQ